jgi:hypothetical protein
MVLDNDTRGWIMAVVSGIGAFGYMHNIESPEWMLTDEQHAPLEVNIDYLIQNFITR